MGAARMGAAMGAGDEGRQPLDAVGETMCDEEVQRPIGHRRLVAQTRRPQPVEKLVGGQRLMALQQRLQHAGPRRGQLQPAVPAFCLHRRQRHAAAGLVVMGAEGVGRRQGRGRQVAGTGCGHVCYVITDCIGSLLLTPCGDLPQSCLRSFPMPRARPVLASVALLSTVALLPCAAQAAPEVVVDVPPIHSIVARVMAGVGTPRLLLAPGASPHDYSLRPSDARAIAGADLLVWVGPSLDPWLDEAADALGASTRLTLDTLPGLTLLPFRSAREVGGGEDAGDAVAEEGHDHDHGAETAGEGGHGHDHGHDHDHAGGLDPHVWLDPGNAIAIASATAQALSEADPDHAAAYAANAAAFATETKALETDIAAVLAPAHDHGYVVFHDAYQYLETRFGLPSAGAILLADGARPSAAHVSRLRAALGTANVSCVFTEPEFDPALATTIVEGTDIRVGRLDGLGIGLTPGADLYPALMRGLADSLADCLAPAT